jgi:hypothetical protein
VAPFAPRPDQVEGIVGGWLLLVSWLVVLLTYRLARREGLDRRWALAAAALLGLASSWLPYVRSFFSESMIGLLLLLALWALRAERAALAALLAGLAMWIKPPFALVGMGWMIERLWAGRPRQALTIGAVMGPMGVALLAFNTWLAGKPLISGAAGWIWTDGVMTSLQTLIGDRQGVISFVPWTALAFAACLASLLDRGGDSLTRQIAIPAFLHMGLLAASAHSGFYSYGPRYWVQMLPWLALATVAFASQPRWRGYRWSLLVLAGLGALFAFPGAFKHHPRLWSQGVTFSVSH